jgi:hypothetical protein
MSVKDDASATIATGCTAHEAQLQLEDKIKIITKRKTVSLVLITMSPMEVHRCGLH